MTLKIITEITLVCERCGQKLSAHQKMIDYTIVHAVELCTCLVDEWKQNRMEEEENAAN